MVPTVASRQVGRSHVAFRLALTICGALLLLATQFYTSAGLSLFVGSTLPPPLSCNRNLEIGAGVQLRDRASEQNLFWDAVTGDSILRLKQQLRDAPKANTLNLLIRTWKMQGGSSAHVSLADLRGVWELHSPTGSGSHPHESNFLRTVLDVYTSSFGKKLDMELISAPRVIVLRDGLTRTVSWLKWGGFTDMVMVSGKLLNLVEGGFRDVPRSLSSKALQVRVPFPQVPRDLHVAYYDGDLLVMRDSTGVVDILWRQREERPPPASAAAPPPPAQAQGQPSWRAAEAEEEDDEEEEEAEVEGMALLRQLVLEASAPLPLEEEDEEEEAGKESAVREKDAGIHASKAEDSSKDAETDKAVAELEVAMERAKQAMPRLKASLAHKKRSMRKLQAKMKHHQKKVSKLTTKHEAERGGKEKAAQVMSRLVNQASDAVGSLRRKNQEAEELQNDAMRELNDLQESVDEHDREVLKLQSKEEDLSLQLPLLKKELNLAPRNLWEAYRVAIASAREDLKETRQSLHRALQQQVENERMLKAAAAKHRRTEAGAAKVGQALELMLRKLERKSRELKAKLEDVNTETRAEGSLEGYKRALHNYEDKAAVLRRMMDEDEAELGGVVEEIPELERQIKDLKRILKRKKKLGGRRFRFPFWPWR